MTDRIVVVILATGILWLDWIMHRQVVAIITILAILGFFAVARSKSFPKLSVGRFTILPIGDELALILSAAASPLYFVTRGSGTFETPLTAALLMLASGAILIVISPILDRVLAKFYRWRDKLPGAIRLATIVVALITIAFGVVHGSLLDIGALFGGTTRSPSSPPEAHIRLYLGVVLAALAAYLVLREPERKTDI